MDIEEVILEATFPTTTTTTATEGQRSQSTPLQWQIQPSISDILFSGFPQQDTQFWLGYKEYHLNVTTERHQHKISKPQRTNAWKFICMLSDSCRRQSKQSSWHEYMSMADDRSEINSPPLKWNTKRLRYSREAQQLIDCTSGCPYNQCCSCICYCTSENPVNQLWPTLLSRHQLSKIKSD